MLSWAHLLHGFCSEFYIKRKKTCLVSVSHYLLQSFQLILQLFCLMLLLPIQRTQTVHLMSHTVERLSRFCWAPWRQWGSTEVEQIEKMDKMISLEQQSWVSLFWFVFWFGFGCFGFFGWTFFFPFYLQHVPLPQSTRYLQMPNFQDVTLTLFTSKSCSWA